MALSTCDEVFHVACQSRSWFVLMQEKNLCLQGNLLPFRCELKHFNLYGKARLTVKISSGTVHLSKMVSGEDESNTAQSSTFSIRTGIRSSHVW